jgi:hypothetical protein
MNTPPGWYPQSDNPNLLRWWDGQHWTDQVRPAEHPRAFTPPAPGKAQSPPVPLAYRRKSGFAITAGILVVSGFLFFPVSVLAAPCFMGAIVFAVLALNKQQGRRGLSVASMCVAPLALMATLIWAISGGSPSTSEAGSASSTPTSVVASDYSAIGERDLALMAKEPDSYKGKRVVVFARVSQFDSATGSCKFLASSSATQEEVTGSFGNNAVFSGGAGGVDCDNLKDVVEKDEVKVLATLRGAYTYEARLGGSLTVPELRIDQIEGLK